ncbi:GT-D fold domain-containing glycosyltransferase [Leuconostoc falkenbergense]|uniref:GT-D fold domain-containing glycosyltransferase n=1 Tax=Leuconostoc falkenbergense TaxID=2766470 RepID=UPI0021AAA6F1|nr:GT-D fold domain-containing glycosyltransferase [Leuconostoc falkenbergense]MCT4390456.1 DUF1792 domain-containing protein [Leuconostoc falkenbergense]
MFSWGKVGKSCPIYSNTKRWYNHKGLIVEGEKTNFGFYNNLLGTAAEVSKIIVPSKNAFSKYEQILELTRETIKTYDKKNLIVLLAIGLTATVLSYDLADNGFQVIDIGHLDVEYQWYPMQAKKKTPLENRTVNEVSDSQFNKIANYNQFKI